MKKATELLCWGRHYLETLNKWHNVAHDFDFQENISLAKDVILDGLKKNKIFACGNGGSACEASHFVGELVGRFNRERGPLPAICLNDNGGLLTCIANDYGADQVFSRQFEAFVKKEDVLVVFSTSGNSTNIIRLLESESIKDVTVIGLLGKGGGKCKDLVDIPIIVPSNETAFIQEFHLNIIHYWCKEIDKTHGI